jgi:hypothetical protein
MANKYHWMPPDGTVNQDDLMRHHPLRSHVVWEPVDRSGTRFSLPWGQHLIERLAERVIGPGWVFSRVCIQPLPSGMASLFRTAMRWRRSRQKHPEGPRHVVTCGQTPTTLVAHADQDWRS